MQQDLTFRGLLTSLFSRSVFEDDLYENFTDLCYLNPLLVYYLTNSLFWLDNFNQMTSSSATGNRRQHFGVISTECSPSYLLYLCVIYQFFCSLIFSRSFLNGLGRFNSSYLYLFFIILLLDNFTWRNFFE